MKRTAIIAGTCLLFVLALFLGTDPKKVPSLVLVLPFLLLFVFVLTLVAFILERQRFSRRKAIKVGALCSGVPLALLVLQSIGQLTIRDVLVLGALFTLSYFYIARSATSS